MRGKKCIPGVLCIENMTLWMIVILVIVFVYLYMQNQTRELNKLRQSPTVSGIQPSVIMVAPPAPVLDSLATVSSRNDPMRNYNAPPVIDDGVLVPSSGLGVPINIRTRGYEEEYKQYGILTRTHGDMILPLMGRRSSNSRDKYQYYTMTNSAGNINTKLPISVNGRSCTSEYGCDQISSGDMVRVEGYNDMFRATIYESSLLSYLPIF